jgi:hypothetical protein
MIVFITRLIVACVAILLLANRADAQNARAAAPVDLTGYWVSVVTTEWKYRMMTPAKGDYDGLPLTPAAKKVADAWDPVKDTAAGEQCRAYGAPALLHMPGRLHITWADDSTLRVEADQGTQTRLFQFGPLPPSQTDSWQGQSRADWQLRRPSTGGGPPSTFAQSTSLKVTTSGLRPGYIRPNGVPYSGESRLTEYFDLVPGVRDDQWLIVSVLLEDPQNLEQPLLRSVQFRKQADATGWNPTPCVARW